jgi:hypothetical protein
MGKQDFDNYDKSLAEEFASKMFQFQLEKMQSDARNELMDAWDID